MHQADREARGSASERGYDARWHKYAKWYLDRHPLCVLCEKAGKTRGATLVDHIVPVSSADDPLFWVESNHQALCSPCHRVKTAKDKRQGLTR